MKMLKNLMKKKIKELKNIYTTKIQEEKFKYQLKDEEINDDFLIKKNIAKMKFKEKIKQIQQNSVSERKNLFEGTIFDEMREKINNILNQPMITYEIPDNINHKEIKKGFLIKDNPNYRGN